MRPRHRTARHTLHRLAAATEDDTMAMPTVPPSVLPQALKSRYGPSRYGRRAVDENCSRVLL